MNASRNAMVSVDSDARFEVVAEGIYGSGITNRWSSRLRGRPELSVQRRKEP